MVTMTCKCGKTTKTFKFMKKSDFPDGWETDCCKEDESWKEVVEAEIVEEEPQSEPEIPVEEVVEPGEDTLIEEESSPESEVSEDVEVPVEESEPEEQPAPKKKTRSRRKKS